MLSWEYRPRRLGGLERVVWALAQWFTKLGYEVHVVTMDHPGCEEYALDGAVHVHRVKGLPEWTPDFHSSMHEFNFGIIQYAARLHNVEPFALIHAHDWMVGAAALTLKQIFGLPLVTTMHATERDRIGSDFYNDLQRYIDQTERRLVELSDKVIVNSRSMYEALTQRWQVPSTKLNVIANGVNPRDLQCDAAVESLRAKYHLPLHGPVILFAGRLVHAKGCDLLIEAALKVLKVFPTATFLIAGDGPCSQELQLRVRYLGIERQVRFWGQANDDTLREFYKLSTCLVMPSRDEPFGLVCIEAMAAHLPVITSDVGGPREINLHLQTGLTTYVGDVDSIVWALLTMLNNPDLVKSLKTAAYERVCALYSWERISRATLRLYDKAMLSVKR